MPRGQHGQYDEHGAAAFTYHNEEPGRLGCVNLYRADADIQVQPARGKGQLFAASVLRY